jgi:putative ABC transport system permease protein
VTRLPLVALILLRRLRADHGPVIALLLIICLSVFTLAAIPRWSTSMDDAGVRQAAGSALATDPGIGVTLRGRVQSTSRDNPLDSLIDMGASYQAKLPAVLQGVINQRTMLAQSASFTVSDSNGQPANPVFERFDLRLQAEPGIAEQIKLVSGRLPQPAASIAPADLGAAGSGLGDQPLPRVEIAVSPEAAQKLNLHIGSRVLLQPDRDDPLTTGVFGDLLNYHLVAEVSGLIKPVDSAAPYWFADDSLAQPSVYQTPDVTDVSGIALINAAAYPTLLGLTAPVAWQYTWRYTIDPNRLNASNVGAVTRALQALQSDLGPASALSNEPDLVSVQTSLPVALERYQGQQRSIDAMLGLATDGLAALAIVVLGLVSVLLAERRRSALALQRSRGAGSAQLLLSQLIEALLLVIPAASLGFIGARTLVPGRGSPASLRAAVATALAAVLLLVLAALPSIQTPLGLLFNRTPVPPSRAERRPSRRLALEGLVVVTTIVGIFMLRQRGLTDVNGDANPYLTLVPVLIGLTVGIFALRLYPPLLRRLARLTRRRRDLVPFVGLRRGAGQPVIAHLPVLVLLLAISLAIFSSVLRHSAQTAQERATWQTTGAAFRVDAPAGGNLSPALDSAALDGVKQEAEAVVKPVIKLVSPEGRDANLTLLALDTHAYAAVTAGTDAEPHFPAALLDNPAPAENTSPLPALIVGALPDQPGVGATLRLTVDGSELICRVVAVRSSFPSVPDNAPAIVVPLANLRASTPGKPWLITRLYLRVPEVQAAKLASDVQSKAPGATLISRDAVNTAAQRAPLFHGVTQFFWITVLLASLYAAAAMIAVLALTTAGQRRDLSYLRTLGLSTRQAIGLTIVEQVLPAILAGVLGAALGIGIACLIAPAIDLDALAGPGGIVRLTVDWSVLIVVDAGLLCLSLTIAVLIGLTLRRLQLAAVLRIGD